MKVEIKFCVWILLNIVNPRLTQYNKAVKFVEKILFKKATLSGRMPKTISHFSTISTIITNDLYYVHFKT